MHLPPLFPWAQRVRLQRALRGLCIPVLVLGAWEWGGRSGVASSSVSFPSAVARALWEGMRSGDLFVRTGETLAAALAGLLGAVLLSLLLGSLLGLYPLLDHLSQASIAALKPVPSVALIPLTLLLFGFGFSMEVTIVAFAVFWPLLILTTSAVAQVDTTLLDVGRMLRLPLGARMLRLVLPSMVPSLASAFRLGLGMAIVVAMTVEIAANPRGLGYAMITAQQSLRPDAMYAALLWIGFLGFVLHQLLRAWERRALAWYWESRSS